jgi:hypothetical protein
VQWDERYPRPHLGAELSLTGGRHSYFAGARLDAPDVREVAADERARRHEPATTRRGGAAPTSGSATTCGLIDPSPARLDALRAIVCHLLACDYRDLLAYGAGWTDPERQRPVGETTHHEPQSVDAIVAAELERALSEPDPLRGIGALIARLAAAFVLDPDGVTRTKALGRERMSRKLDEALPSGDTPLRSALWAFVRPMLSPRLAELHRDAFVTDEQCESTVDLAAHRSDSSLDDLNLEPDFESDDPTRD